MANEKKNLQNETELLEFLKNLPTLWCKKPSTNGEDVKHVDFRQDGIKDAVLDSFKKGKKEDKGSEEQQESEKHETGLVESKGKSSVDKGKEIHKKSDKKEDKGSEEQQESKKPETGESKGKSSADKGREIHKKIDEYLKERRKKKEAKKGQDDNNREQLPQVENLKVVEEVETGFECSIVASEVGIQGFATTEQEQHYWIGKMDAVALDKNGRVLVIDWVTCDGYDVTEFWTKAGYFSKKLHQCLIYRELVNAHLNDSIEYFGTEKMDSGIMIVAIDSENINVFDPRLCVNFESLEEKGFFKIINEFTWQGSKLRGRIEKLDRVQQELQQTQDRLANSERSRQSAGERQVKDKEVKIKELEAQGNAMKNQIKTLEQRLDRVKQDLQQTQDCLLNSESSRKSAERQVKDMKVKIKELEDQIEKLEKRLDRVKQDLQQIQDRLANSERSRKSAERQVKDKEVKIKELEDQIEKLEKRVRELEVYLYNETRRAAENQENFSKQERRLMDVLQQQNKNLKHFKDQIDRGREEHQAAQYLAKVHYDKLQKDLKDAEDRAETAESELNKARSRACVSGAGAGGRMDGCMDNLYFKHDPWLHHYASPSGGPSMSPEIARSARLLQLSAERETEPCLCESPKKCAHSRGRGLCSCKADGLTCTNKCSCSRWECKNRF